VPANAKTKLGENKTKWKEDRLLISTEKPYYSKKTLHLTTQTTKNR
jgi:hypothetical protein